MKIIYLLLIIFTQFFTAQTVTACSTDEQSVEKANRIWEQAVTAKGGRERLLSIENLLTFDKKEDYVTFNVFPDKSWRWSNDGKPIGLIVQTLDYSKGIGYIVHRWDKPPFPSHKLESSTRESNLANLLPLLLETKWIKPELIGAETMEINGRKFDVVCTVVNHIRKEFSDFVFDQETHLLSRVIQYGGKSLVDKRLIIDYDNYVEINGVKFPQKEINRFDDGTIWSKSEFKVQTNVEYKKDLFDKPPSIEDGSTGWRESKKQKSK